MKNEEPSGFTNVRFSGVPFAFIGFFLSFVLIWSEAARQEPSTRRADDNMHSTIPKKIRHVGNSLGFDLRQRQ